jgi:hypothetical protein
VLGPILLIGLGFGLVMLPVIATATAGMGAGQAGLASAVANTSRQLGGAVGLSVLVTIAATVTSHNHVASPAAATVHGYRTALVICAAASLAAALVALLLPRAARSAPAAPAGRPETSRT